MQGASYFGGGTQQGAEFEEYLAKNGIAFDRSHELRSSVPHAFRFPGMLGLSFFRSS